MSDQSFRRKWNREEFLQLAQNRIQSLGTKQSDESGSTSTSSARSLVTEGKPGKKGFFCDSCQFTCHDYTSYLEHLNNWKHRKSLHSQSSSQPAVTVEGVRNFLQQLADKSSNPSSPTEISEEQIEQRLEKGYQEKQAKKDQKKLKKKQFNKQIESDPQIEEMKAAGFDFVK